MYGVAAMKKSAIFTAIIGFVLLVSCVLLIAAIVDSSSVASSEDHQKAITTTLVGHNLTYYSIAGKPLNYTLGPGDIQQIERSSYNGSPVWNVHVGQGLAWDLTLDETGTHILEIRQLLQT
jgi:uncharacterized protein YpmB